MAIFNDYSWGRLYVYSDNWQLGTDVTRYPDVKLRYKVDIKEEYKNSTPAYTTLWEAKTGNTSAHFIEEYGMGADQIAIRATGNEDGYSYFYLRIVKEDDPTTYIDSIELKVIGIKQDTVLTNSISIFPTKVTLRRGDSRQAKVIFRPSNATYKLVDWRSPQGGVCTIEPRDTLEVSITAIRKGGSRIICDTTTDFDRQGCWIPCEVLVDTKSNDIISIENDVLYVNNVFRPAVKITGLSYGTATVVCSTVDGNIQKELVVTVNSTGLPEEGSDPGTNPPSGGGTEILLHKPNNELQFSNTHSGEAETGNFAVKCSSGWECSTNDNWILPSSTDLNPWSGTAGTATSSITLFYQVLKNNTTSSRTGQITGRNKSSNNTSIFTIIQDAAETNLKLRLEISSGNEVNNSTSNYSYDSVNTSITVIPQKKVGNVFEDDNTLSWSFTCNNSNASLNPTAGQYTGRKSISINIPENTSTSNVTTKLTFTCTLDGFTTTNSYTIKQDGKPVQESGIKLVLLNMNNEDVTNSSINDIPFAGNSYSFHVYPYKLNNGTWEINQSIQWTISSNGSPGMFNLSFTQYSGVKTIQLNVNANPDFYPKSSTLTFDAAYGNFTCSSQLTFNQVAFEIVYPSSVKIYLEDSNGFELGDTISVPWNTTSLTINATLQGKYNDNETTWQTISDIPWSISVTPGGNNLAIQNLQTQYTSPVSLSCQLTQNNNENEAAIGFLTFNVQDYEYFRQISISTQEKPTEEKRILLLNTSDEDITNSTNIQISPNGENYTIKVYPQKKPLGEETWVEETSTPWTIETTGNMNLTIQNLQTQYTGNNTINIVALQNNSEQRLSKIVKFKYSNLDTYYQVMFSQDIYLEHQKRLKILHDGQTIACPNVSNLPQNILFDSTGGDYIITVQPEKGTTEETGINWTTDNTTNWTLSESGSIVMDITPNYQQYTGTNELTISYLDNASHSQSKESTLTFNLVNDTYPTTLNFIQTYNAHQQEEINGIRILLYKSDPIDGNYTGDELSGSTVSLESSSSTTFPLYVIVEKQVDGAWSEDSTISWTATISPSTNGVTINGYSGAQNSFVGEQSLEFNITENTSTTDDRLTTITFSGSLQPQEGNPLSCSTYIRFNQPKKSQDIGDIRLVFYHDGVELDTDDIVEFTSYPETYNLLVIPQKYDTTINDWVEDTNEDIAWNWSYKGANNIGINITPLTLEGTYSGRYNLQLDIPALTDTSTLFRTTTISFSATCESVLLGRIDEIVFRQVSTVLPGTLSPLSTNKNFYYDSTPTIQFKVTTISNWRVEYEMSNFSSSTVINSATVSSGTSACTDNIISFNAPVNNDNYSHKYIFKLYVENALVDTSNSYTVYPYNMTTCTDNSTVFEIIDICSGNSINNHLAEEHFYDICIVSNVEATVSRNSDCTWLTLGPRDSQGEYGWGQYLLNISKGRTIIRLYCQNNSTGGPRTGTLTMVSNDTKAIQTFTYTFSQKGTHIDSSISYGYFVQRAVLFNNSDEVSVLNIRSNVVTKYLTTADVTFINNQTGTFEIGQTNIQVKIGGSRVLVQLVDPNGTSTYDEGMYLQSINRGTTLEEEQIYSLY